MLAGVLPAPVLGKPHAAGVSVLIKHRFWRGRENPSRRGLPPGTKAWADFAGRRKFLPGRSAILSAFARSAKVPCAEMAGKDPYQRSRGNLKRRTAIEKISLRPNAQGERGLPKTKEIGACAPPGASAKRERPESSVGDSRSDRNGASAKRERPKKKRAALARRPAPSKFLSINGTATGSSAAPGWRSTKPARPAAA